MPRKLDDVARRRFQVWLRAAQRRPVVEPDGDRAAGTVCPARISSDSGSIAGVGSATVVEVVDEGCELVRSLLVHEKRSPKRQSSPRALYRRDKDTHGIFALARVDRGDLDAAETPAAGRDNLDDRLWPGNQRQLAARYHYGARCPDPAFK